MLLPLFFTMRAFPNTTWFWECDTHDVHGEGVGMDRARAWTGRGHGQGAGMDRVRAWTGHGHGQGVGMDRVRAWTRHGHGQGVGEGVAGTWLTLSYELGARTMARKDGS